MRLNEYNWVGYKDHVGSFEMIQLFIGLGSTIMLQYLAFPSALMVSLDFHSLIHCKFG